MASSPHVPPELSKLSSLVSKTSPNKNTRCCSKTQVLHLSFRSSSLDKQDTNKDRRQLCGFLNMTRSPDFNSFAPSLKGSFVHSRSRREPGEELHQFQTGRRSLALMVGRLGPKPRLKHEAANFLENNTTKRQQENICVQPRVDIITQSSLKSN